MLEVQNEHLWMQKRIGIHMMNDMTSNKEVLFAEILDSFLERSGIANRMPAMEDHKMWINATYITLKQFF